MDRCLSSNKRRNHWKVMDLYSKARQNLQMAALAVEHSADDLFIRRCPYGEYDDKAFTTWNVKNQDGGNNIWRTSGGSNLRAWIPRPSFSRLEHSCVPSSTHSLWGENSVSARESLFLFCYWN